MVGIHPPIIHRAESMKAEVGALHEAMAGLHGEMGAVQRELDGAKAGQDKLAAGGREVAANDVQRLQDKTC